MTRDETDIIAGALRDAYAMTDNSEAETFGVTMARACITGALKSMYPELDRDRFIEATQGPTAPSGSVRALTADELLSRLYASEINVRLESFWDGGWTWYLGSEGWFGFAATGNSRSFSAAVHEVVQAAITKYPTSAFAREMAAIVATEGATHA